MPTNLTTEQFIDKATQVHGDRYDYSLVEYLLPHTKVKITCKLHGIFEQTPNNHNNGRQGCPTCSGKQRSSTAQFTQKAQQLHNKYDYSLVEYKNNKTKVKIICPVHGGFEQTPSKHLSGTTCPKCLGRYKTTQDFIQQATQVHGSKYDYSQVKYKQNSIKLSIMCNTHGEFLQRPDNHLQGQGCPNCAGNIRKTTEQFIVDAVAVHDNKYDYSLVEYSNTGTKVQIICKEHGVFEQTPVNHVTHKQGCPKCGNWISKPEIKWLEQHNVPNTPNNRQVLIKIDGKKYKVDGYVPETNTVYEFYGDFWHGNPNTHDFADTNPITKTTFGELHKRTLDKRQTIINAGYNLIELWEGDK